MFSVLKKRSIINILKSKVCPVDNVLHDRGGI